MLARVFHGLPECHDCQLVLKSFMLYKICCNIGVDDAVQGVPLKTVIQNLSTRSSIACICSEAIRGRGAQ